jgi:hypothetical protein
MNRSTQFLRELLREDDLGRYGCCAGPMQFSLVGSPSTWDSYGVDGDRRPQVPLPRPGCG